MLTQKTINSVFQYLVSVFLTQQVMRGLKLKSPNMIHSPCPWSSILLRKEFFQVAQPCFKKPVIGAFPALYSQFLKLPSLRSLPTAAVQIASISVFLLRICHSSLGGNKFTLSSRPQKFLWKSQLKSKHCFRLYYFVVREQDIMTFFLQQHITCQEEKNPLPGLFFFSSKAAS